MVVADFLEGSPAADAELQRGDVIEQVDRHPLRFLSDYVRLIRLAKKQPFVYLVNRNITTTSIVVEPE